MGYEKYRKIYTHLPSKATLERRIVIDDNLESYVAKLENPLGFDGFDSKLIVIMPKSDKRQLDDSGKILIHFFLIPSRELLSAPVLYKEDFVFAGWAASRRME